MANPSPTTIKAHLTNAIRKADLTTVSAKQIRRIVEKELNLPDNELSSEKWKAGVKKWIQEALAALDADEGLEREVQEVQEVEEKAGKRGTDEVGMIFLVERAKSSEEEGKESYCGYAGKFACEGKVTETDSGEKECAKETRETRRKRGRRDKFATDEETED
jgi:DEK C terminal domain